MKGLKEEGAEFLNRISSGMRSYLANRNVRGAR